MTAALTPWESAAAWQARAYRDHENDGGVLEWADPVERLASYLYGLRYLTPETAHGATVGRYPASSKTWAALDGTQRQLWRRRAALAITLLDMATEGGTP